MNDPNAKTSNGPLDFSSEPEWPDLEKHFVRQLFFNSPVGIYIIQNGRFQLVNPEFERITGYSENELKGVQSLTLVHEDDREMVRQQSVQMLKGMKSSPYTARIRHKDGEVRHILETICSIKYKGQRSALGYFLDNTEQEMTKEALRTSQEKFHRAFRSSPDWMIISTLNDGVYLEVNQAFLNTTGFAHEEVIGKSSTELGIWVDPDERDELHEILKAAGKVCNAEVRFRNKAGEILHVLWSAEVIEYGGQQCIIAVTRDITDRKLAQQEQLRREKLQGVLEMAGAACHEMNQPLQNIVFMLDELIEENQNSETCKQIRSQVQRIRSITSKLENITTYETKEYIQGSKIIDIDKASFQCLLDT